MRFAAVLASFLLYAVACETTSGTANNSPATSPTESSPSSSPSSTPTGGTTGSTGTPSTTTSPAGSALAITNLPFHNGEVGIIYLAVTLGAGGGTPPYSWSIDGGTFPPGLTLGTDGTVTGKNTQAGQFKFDVKVTDSTGGTATSPSGFGVFTAMTVRQPCASQCIVGAGCAKCGGFGSVSGGLAPYTYKIVGGYVPDGMTLSGLSLKGAFPQTPLGAFNLSVQVTDVFTASATVNATWFVYNPAILNPGTDCFDPNFTGRCSATGWTYNGGWPSDPSVKVIGVRPYCPDGCFYPDPQGKLPPLWAATAKGGALTIQAGLNPTCTTYAAILTIELVDVSPCATTIPSNVQDIIVVVGSNPTC